MDDDADPPRFEATPATATRLLDPVVVVIASFLGDSTFHLTGITAAWLAGGLVAAMRVVIVLVVVAGGVTATAIADVIVVTVVIPA